MPNRIGTLPPIKSGCTLFSKVTGVQECDATDDDSSNSAGNIKSMLEKIEK